MNIQNILLSLLSIGILSCGKDADFKSGCLPSNLQSGVIAFYPFSNGSLLDASANTNNLANTTLAAPTSDRNGNQNCAYQFDNMQPNAEFLTNSQPNFLDNLNEFSVSLWYEPLDLTRGGEDFELLLGRGDQFRCPDRNGEWSVGLYDCRRAVFGHNNSVWANPVTGLSGGCDGEVVELTDKWHHVVATKVGNAIKIYFNGNLDESASGNAQCTNLHLAQDVGDLFLGKYYNGKIDDVIIYNRALTQTEISQLFTIEPCC